MSLIRESIGPIAQSRLERTPDKREVVGSIPTRPTKFRGCSSVGRAPALHAGGHRFDPVHLHHCEKGKLSPKGSKLETERLWNL